MSESNTLSGELFTVYELNKGIKHCVVCGKDISHLRQQTGTCSNACRCKLYRMRKKERMKNQSSIPLKKAC